MRKLFYLLIILLLFSCGEQRTATVSVDSANQSSEVKVTAESILSQMDKEKYREGELLVRFKSGVVTASSVKTHQAVGASVVKRFSLVPNLEHVRLPQGVPVRDALVKYMSDPTVLYAEPNYVRRATATIPNDTFFSQQYALRNTGQIGGTSGADIKATEAWDITKGNRNVIIAVLDSGINFHHPDLAANIWVNTGETSCTDGIDNDNNGFIDDCNGWNFVSDNNNPIDENGHGTHVAGTIGAVTNNGTGIAGVMWNVQLMPLKFLAANGEGFISDEIAGIAYAIKKGAKIINASFGGTQFVNTERDAIAAANASGILFIAAAGNDNGGTSVGGNNDVTPEYPASYQLPNIIAVAATDQNDNRASFSNFGKNSVHVAAPGVRILSTFPPDRYEFLSGTSMSTPHVSGLAGLLFSQYPQFTHIQVWSTILRYVDVLPSLQNLIVTGGRINAFRAVSSLLQPSGLSVSVPSSSQIRLTWNDNATGEDGYKIDRRAGSGNFTQIAVLGGNATSFDDTSLADGTTFSYRVRAFNNIGDSLFSGEASGTTPLNAPASLVAVAVSSTQVNLAWQDNAQAEDGFAIERSQTGAVFVQIATVGPNATTFADSGAVPSTSFSYRVRAVNATGNSPFSNEAFVTTPAAGGSSSGGGGGGCSIASTQKEQRGDVVLMLAPLAVLLLLRRKRT